VNKQGKFGSNGANGSKFKKVNLESQQKHWITPLQQAVGFTIEQTLSELKFQCYESIG
jgi:hypothetical protein